MWRSFLPEALRKIASPSSSGFSICEYLYPLRLSLSHVTSITAHGAFPFRNVNFFFSIFLSISAYTEMAIVDATLDDTTTRPDLNDRSPREARESRYSRYKIPDYTC
jgi:hypothetical protein